MRLRHLAAATLTAVSLSAASVCAPVTAQAAPAASDHHRDKPGHYSFAVIGDAPYGDQQIAAFPRWIDQINASDVQLTFHVGDIKNGSTRCDDSYFAMIKGQFDRVRTPLIYTPGDNEWTDCHRTNNGSYEPLERLDAIRSTFFARPGTTLGQHPTRVRSQAYRGVPENVELRRQRITFATIHVVGSNDDLKPWTGIGKTEPTQEQFADQARRMGAAIAQVKRAYADAARRHDRAVVILLQADMFDPTWNPTWNDMSAFRPLVQTLIDESNRFRGESYLFDGDSHVFNVDHPLAEGSAWLGFYGVRGASSLTRITVDGDKQNTDWLKVTVNRPGAGGVLSWERIPYTQ